MTDIRAIQPEPLTPEEQLLAQLISDGAPFFILKADDFFSVPILAAYIKMVEDYGPRDFALQEELYNNINRLREWQTDNPDKVRFPHVLGVQRTNTD